MAVRPSLTVSKLCTNLSIYTVAVVHNGVLVQLCIWIYLTNMEVNIYYSWKCLNFTPFVDFHEQSAKVSMFRFSHQGCGSLLRTLHALPVWIMSSYFRTRSAFDCVETLNCGLFLQLKLTRCCACLLPSNCWGSTCPLDPVIRNQLNNNKRADRPITGVVVCVDAAHHHNSLKVHVKLRVPLWSFNSPILEASSHLALRPFHRALIYVCCSPTEQVAGGPADDLWVYTQTAVSNQDWAWTKQDKWKISTNHDITHIRSHIS